MHMRLSNLKVRKKEIKKNVTSCLFECRSNIVRLIHHCVCVCIIDFWLGQCRLMRIEIVTLQSKALSVFLSIVWFTYRDTCNVSTFLIISSFFFFPSISQLSLDLMLQLFYFYPLSFSLLHFVTSLAFTKHDISVPFRSFLFPLLLVVRTLILLSFSLTFSIIFLNSFIIVCFFTFFLFIHWFIWIWIYLLFPFLRLFM